MKTLLYISSATSDDKDAAVPSDLAKILYQGRRDNAAHGISSAIAYRSGYYIQVLEGPDVSVDRLFKKLKKDPRHESVQVLNERSTSFRRFPSSPLRLVSEKNDKDFISYIDTYFRDGTERCAKCLQILSSFFDIETQGIEMSADESGKTSPYAGLKLSLKKWPRFDTVRPTRAVVELCVALRHQPSLYEDLADIHSFASITELDGCLMHLDDSELLSVTDPLMETLSDIKTTMKKRSSRAKDSGSFYNKMKRFLRFAA